MDKNFCRQIDQQFLVEDYVAGKLKGELLLRFEQHISQCEKHAQAVALEKAMRKGISEYARGEIKAKLKERLKRKEDTRTILLRYAAILLVAVITPLMIYYQFKIAPEKLPPSMSPSQRSQLQRITIDSLEDQRSSSGASQNLTQEREIIKRQPATAVKEKHQIKSQEEDLSAERKAEILKPGVPKSTEAENEALQESPVKNEAELPPIAAEERAIKPAKTVPAPAAIGTGGLQGKLSVASQKDMPTLNAEINTRVTRDSVQIKSCMEAHLNGEPLEKYSITLKLTILPNGEVGKVKILETTSHSQELEKCLTAIINDWLVTPDSEEKSIEVIISYKMKVR